LKAKKVKKEAKSSGNYNVLIKKKDHSKENSAFTLSDARKDGRNRYALEFRKETQAELQASKERALQPYTHVADLTVSTEEYFDPTHDFPKRPLWDSSWTRDKLEQNEQRIFRQYVTKLLKLEPPPQQKRKHGKGAKREEQSENLSETEEFSEDGSEVDDLETEEKPAESSNSGDTAGSELSHFELNLETWRQLWRVLEKSHILLVILDVRYAPATFPPSLYRYIKEKGKEIIIVLNKIDLIKAELAAAWKNYFQSRYPGIHVVYFTSFPSYNLVGRHETGRGLQIRKKKTNFTIVKEASEEIWEICNRLYGKQIDLSSWKKKISGHDIDTKIVHEAYDHTKEAAGDAIIDGTLVIGTIGHPNVGKSSLINSLNGKKVVSVSRTPGHTKHFQTIYLTQNVQLCDCPGLVFPSKVPKQLQVLMGSFPIAQLREPYSAIQFLAERIDLPRILNIELDEEEKAWTAFHICEQFATLKGFVTARTCRPDAYRAANMMLRFALDGRVPLGMTPPSYVESDWTDHKDTKLAESITAFKREAEAAASGVYDADSQGSDDDFDGDDDDQDGDSQEGGDEGGDNDEDSEPDSDSDDDTDLRSGSNPFAALAAKSP